MPLRRIGAGDECIVEGQQTLPRWQECRLLVLEDSVECLVHVAEQILVILNCVFIVQVLLAFIRISLLFQASLHPDLVILQG